MYTISINGNEITCFYDNGKGEVYQAQVNTSNYTSQALAIEDAQSQAIRLSLTTS